MAEMNTASSVSRVLETAALDRIRALFDEQAFAAAGLGEPDREPRDERPDPDRFAAVWLDPLLDGQGVAEYGDYGFSRPGDEDCVCGAYTPEEKAAADRRIGISDFSPDVIAHARRLCRFLQLSAPSIILQHAAANLAEALVLHRHAGSCILIPAAITGNR